MPSYNSLCRLKTFAYGCYYQEYEYCTPGNPGCSSYGGYNRAFEYEYGCSSTCFPASSTVMTDRGMKKMNELQIGDNVQIEGGDFEPVYAFGAHKTSHPESVMITVDTKRGKRLSLSPSHWMFVEENGSKTAIKAMDVREGHVVYVEGTKKDLVTKTSAGVMKGLFNPMTASGTILVDDVLVSVYAGKSHPDHLHLLTTPARMASKMMSTSTLQTMNEMFGSVFGFDGETVPSWLLAMDTVLSTVTHTAGSSGNAFATMASASCLLQQK